MTEEMKPDTAQESQSNVAENKPESPSNEGLLSEVMAKKAKIREQDEIIAQYKADEETGRQKSMEEQGQLKELVAELRSANKDQAVKLERADKIEMQLKVDIINSITSDDAKREELATKDIETLRFIQNEVGNKTVNNPQESLGSVRVKNNLPKDWTTMSPKDAKDNWAEILANAQKK